MRDIKKMWDKILNAEKQSQQAQQPTQPQAQSKPPEETEAMQKIIKTTKDTINAIQPDLKQLNEDMFESLEELSKIKELSPEEYSTFESIYKDTQSIYSRLLKFEKYLKNYQIYRKVQEFLATAKTGQYKFFTELDIYLTSRAYSTEDALTILDYDKESYEYKFNENPVALLSEIKRQEDNKIQSEMATLKTSISLLPSDLIEELEKEYDFDIEKEEDITKLTHILMQRVKDEIPPELRPDVVNDLLNAERLIVSQISVSTKIAMYTQAGSDLVLQVIRGFDKKVEQLAKEKVELSNDILKKHEEISDLEKQLTALRTKINQLERQKMELEDNIKELKAQSARHEAESSLLSEPQPTEPTFTAPTEPTQPEQPEEQAGEEPSDEEGGEDFGDEGNEDNEDNEDVDGGEDNE